MAAIAAEAGVALKTVYLAFDSKSGVLRALWNRVLRGDDESLPVAGRDWYRAVLEEPDPERQLRLNAHNARVVKERAGAVLEIIRNASQADPAIAALWQRIQEEFLANQRAIIETLAAREALRPGLGVDAGRRPRCGRSTTPPCGRCSSASAGGRPSASRPGWPTRSARSCSGSRRRSR